MYIKYINKVYNIIKLSFKSIEKNVFYFCVPFKKLSKHDYAHQLYSKVHKPNETF